MIAEETLAPNQKTRHVPYYSGRLVAINVADGTERWRTGDSKSGFIWPAAPFGDRVYIAGSGGGFVALRR